MTNNKIHISQLPYIEWNAFRIKHKIYFYERLVEIFENDYSAKINAWPDIKFGLEIEFKTLEDKVHFILSL